MRLLAISLLFAAALAIEEPEPITEEEKHDEVAQAQQRGKWLACLMLTRQFAIDGEAALEPVLKESKHDRDKTLAKIKADVMLKCSTGITVKLSEELLASESVDIADADLQEFLKIDTESLNDPKKDISLTKEQLDLYAAIKEEMNRTDDGFEQDPPVVENFDPSTYAVNELGVSNTIQHVSLAAGSTVFLGLLYVCWKRIKQPVSKSEAKRQKKQEEKKKKR